MPLAAFMFAAFVVAFIITLFVAGAYHHLLKQKYPEITDRAYRSFVDVAFHRKFPLNPWFLLFKKLPDEAAKDFLPLKLCCAFMALTAVGFTALLIAEIFSVYS